MRLDQEGGDRGEASGGGSPTRLKILSIATLWPNVLSPQQGAHAERRLRLLQELGGAHVRVVAPIANRDENARGLRRRVFAPGRRESAVPELEKRASIVIHHPHFWDLGSASRRVLGVRRGLISEAAETLGRRFHQAAVNRMVQRLWRRFGPFDLIDAHGLGVDGAAAQALAAQLGTPFMATVYAGAERLRAATGGARRRLMKVTEAAAVTLAQGEDQAEALLAMGVDRSRLCVIRPGVDLERFKPTADEAERRKLKAGCGAPEDAPLILSIPGAAPMDEHARAIVAVAETPDAHLRAVSAGAQEAALRRLAEERGVAGRVDFVELTDLRAPELLRAADAALCLVDGPEGRAAALESLASGTPTVASPFAEQAGLQGQRAVAIAPRDAILGPPGAAGPSLAKALEGLSPRDLSAAASLRAEARASAERHPLRPSVDDLSAACRHATQVEPTPARVDAASLR